MLNSVNSPDLMDSSDPMIFPNFVNLHNLVCYSHLIRGFHLINAFDQVVDLTSREGNPISQDIGESSELS